MDVSAGIPGKFKEEGAIISSIWKTLNLDMSYNKNSFNLIKNCRCSNYTSDYYNENREYILRHIVNDNVVQKWADCMAKNFGGLKSILMKSGTNTYELTIEFVTSLHNMKLKKIKINTDNMSMSEGSLRPNSLSSNNPYSMSFYKNDKSKIGRIAILGRYKTGSFFGWDQLQTAVIIPVDYPEVIDHQLVALYKYFLIPEDEGKRSLYNENDGDPQCNQKYWETYTPTILTITKDIIPNKYLLSYEFDIIEWRHVNHCTHGYYGPVTKRCKGQVSAEIKTDSGKIKITKISGHHDCPCSYSESDMIQRVKINEDKPISLLYEEKKVKGTVSKSLEDSEEELIRLH